jgi:hypothetical protein
VELIDNGWGLESFSPFLFSFELLTTIGYGEIAPKTVGGRLWLCIFTLLSVPLGGLCLTRIASGGMDLVEWAVQCADPHLKRLFAAFDGDRDKLLNEAEARHVLTVIEGTPPSDDDFHASYAAAHVMHRKPGGLTFAEFVRLYMFANNAELQHRRRWRKLWSSSIVVCMWLVIGMLVFNHFEQWGHLPSFYFCFVTLTTVGLGDFYPSALCALRCAMLCVRACVRADMHLPLLPLRAATDAGESFHFFYCVTGLGLVAVLLNAISDVATEDALDEEEEQEQIMDLIWMETPGGRPPTLEFGSGDPKKDSKKVQLTTKALRSLDTASKATVLRFLMSDLRAEPWFAAAMLPYAPQAPPPPPPPPPPAAPVIKVFGPEFPTAAAKGGKGRGGAGNPSANAVPAFKPSYTQLYDDEPYNLSGAPKPGFPLFDDIQFRNTLNGRGTDYDRDAVDVSHGPYEQDDGLTGQVLGQLAMPAIGSGADGGWGIGAGRREVAGARAASPHSVARRAATMGYNGADDATLGDDGVAWEAGRGGGERPRGVPRYREQPSNRL